MCLLANSASIQKGNPAPYLFDFPSPSSWRAWWCGDSPSHLFCGVLSPLHPRCSIAQFYTHTPWPCFWCCRLSPLFCQFQFLSGQFHSSQEANKVLCNRGSQVFSLPQFATLFQSTLKYSWLEVCSTNSTKEYLYKFIKMQYRFHRSIMRAQ